MAERTLGDVPGIADMLQYSSVAPTDYSVYEVDGLGQLTTGEVSPVGDGDPFSYKIGFLDDDGDGTEGGDQVGGGPINDPMVGSYLPSFDGDDYASQPVGDYTAEQVENAEIIAEVGESVGATPRDVQVAIMAAIVESNLQNLDHGDRDSIGMFQQRDAWGSREDRLDPYKSARMFFLGGAGGQEGLLDIPAGERKRRGLGELAQDVQVSAYPDRYAEHEAEASALLGQVRGGHKTHGKYGDDPYGLTEWDGKTVDNFTAAALEAATKTFGANFGVMQGSHNPGGVSASGGTHDGGGVVDLDVPNGDWEGALAALRKTGFAAWIRNMPGYGQAGSGAHIHAVLIGNRSLSPEALLQVNSYLHDDDGLSGSRADDGPRQWIDNRFVWGEAPSQRRKQRGPTWRDQVIKEARQFIGSPFRWGGEDYDGVDAVGFVRNVYSKFGVDLPKTAFAVAYAAEPMEIADTKPGDLIAWNQDDGDQGLGVYLGNGRFVEAGAPGRVVQINELGTAALDAWGIPIKQLIQQPGAPRSRPAPAEPTSSYAAPPNKFAHDMDPAYGGGSSSGSSSGPRGGGRGPRNGGGGTGPIEAPPNKFANDPFFGGE